MIFIMPSLPPRLSDWLLMTGIFLLVIGPQGWSIALLIVIAKEDKRDLDTRMADTRGMFRQVWDLGRARIVFLIGTTIFVLSLVLMEVGWRVKLRGY